MNIHLISIGGAVMHNIALALKENGHTVTGSDDEIYNPSRQRLDDAGLLPKEMGWFPERIHKGIDTVILGMHAWEGNPEIERAKELGIPMYSFPEFIYEHAKDKKRVVVAGSHGKTSTTSMIMHALKCHKLDFDYLVGGQIEGFDLMVRLSDAPITILEGDEYLSSALDRRPKMLHYKADLAVITGIAWDHMNVFPTFDNYREQFDFFIDSCEENAKIYCFDDDKEVAALMERKKEVRNKTILAYNRIDESIMATMQVFGPHNRANMQAAQLICADLGIAEEDFYRYMTTFTGTAKRLQKLIDRQDIKVFFDFAHAPSKLQATVEAVKTQFPNKKLVALYELHTYSSLNKDFLPHYASSMDMADEAVVFFNAHTLEMKKMPPLSSEFVGNCFANDSIHIFNHKSKLVEFLNNEGKEDAVYLFMTSGNFEKLDILSFFNI